MTRFDVTGEGWTRRSIVALTVCASVAALASSGCSSNWKEVASGAPASLTVTPAARNVDLHDVVTRGNEVWIVGAEGTLIYSSDGGQHFVRRNSGTTDDLKEITASADGASLWILAEGGGLLHSQDHGSNWNAVVTSAQAADALFVTPDGSHVYVVGGAIASSHDGGRTWAQARPVDMIRTISGVVTDSSGQHVWAAGGGALVHSADGGTTWQVKQAPGDLVAGLCADDCSRIWFAGFDGRAIDSADGGATWTSAQLPTTDAVMRLTRVPATGRVIGVTDAALMVSADGRTWTARPLEPGVAAKAVAPLGAQGDIIVVGEAEYIARSRDDGRTWVELGRNTKVEAPEAIAKSVNGNRLCVVGSGLTRNANLIACASAEQGPWTAEQPVGLKRTDRLSDIQPLGKKEWIAIATDGVVLKSGNDGESWTILDQRLKGTLRNLAASRDGMKVMAVGGGGLIVQSLDRGESWMPLSSGVTKDLSTIFVSASGQRIVVAGAGGTLLVSDDGGRQFVNHPTGQTATLQTATGTPDGSKLWVAGQGGVVFRSMDGGRTWERRNQRGPSLDLQALAVSDDGRRLAALGEVDNAGQLLLSSDGGESWNTAFDETVSLYGVLGGYAEGHVLQVWGHSYSVWQQFTIRDGTPLPVIRRARLSATVDGKARLLFEGERLDMLDAGDVRIWAANALNRDDPQPLHDVSIVKPSANGTWTATFDVRQAGVVRGQVLYLDVEVQARGWRHRYVVAEDGLLYDPFGFWREHWIWLASLGTLAALLATLSLLLWLRPRTLLRIYDLEQYVGDLSSWLSRPLQILLAATILPAFAQHVRVLDAWVRLHRSRARAAFDLASADRAAKQYVPLPVRVTDRGTQFVLEQPKPEGFGALLSGPRTVVQIVGPGGAGKTALAVQLARWLFDEDNEGPLMGHPVIVVLLDEDATDIRAAVRARIRSWLTLDTDLPDRLFDALLRKRRIVVLFDRLSERKPEVIRAVETVHSRVSLNTLILTSRRRLRIDGTADALVQPEPLGSGTLLYFVTSLLQNHENLGGFGLLTDQLRLGERFIPLLRSEVIQGDVPVTPLLVQLFVDRAIELLRTTGSLNEVPVSVPDLYFEYLRRLNVDEENGVPNVDMLRAAQACALLAVEPDFVPKEFTETQLRAALPAAGMDAAVSRLLANGVMIRRESGAESTFRFVLDPVAEYLAAFACAQRAAGDANRWVDLVERCAASEIGEGFSTALKLTWERYHQELRWIPFFPSLQTPAAAV